MMKLMSTKCISLERENFRFPNCRENQVNGDSTSTNKLRLQYKVAAKVPFRWVEFVHVSPTVQFSLQDFFLHLFFARFLFSFTPCCMIYFCFYLASPPPVSLFQWSVPSSWLLSPPLMIARIVKSTGIESSWFWLFNQFGRRACLLYSSLDVGLF